MLRPFGPATLVKFIQRLQRRSRRRPSSAMRNAVGTTSFVDWDMLTWPWGVHVVRTHPLGMPNNSSARLAMTSLAFMLMEVPSAASNGDRRETPHRDVR